MFRSFVGQFLSEYQGGNCTHLLFKVSIFLFWFCIIMLMLYLGKLFLFL